MSPVEYTISLSVVSNINISPQLLESIPASVSQSRELRLRHWRHLCESCRLHLQVPADSVITYLPLDIELGTDAELLHSLASGSVHIHIYSCNGECKPSQCNHQSTLSMEVGPLSAPTMMLEILVWHQVNSQDWLIQNTMHHSTLFTPMECATEISLLSLWRVDHGISARIACIAIHSSNITLALQSVICCRGIVFVARVQAFLLELTLQGSTFLKHSRPCEPLIAVDLIPDFQRRAQLPAKSPLHEPNGNGCLEGNDSDDDKQYTNFTEDYRMDSAHLVGFKQQYSPQQGLDLPFIAQLCSQTHSSLECVSPCEVRSLDYSLATLDCTTTRIVHIVHARNPCCSIYLSAFWTVFVRILCIQVLSNECESSTIRDTPCLVWRLKRSIHIKHGLEDCMMFG